MNNIEIFQAENGAIEFRGDTQQETVWASLDQIAKLFCRDKYGISRHIKNIFNSGELEKDSVVAIFATTASDGKRYQVEYYNLDIILSVGYRVDSKEVTIFRKWANSILKKYLLDGYAINEKKLTQTKELLNNLKFTINFLSTKEILTLLRTYTQTLSLLEGYDKSSTYQLTYKEATKLYQASFLYIYFLDRCNYLYKANGEKKINENALITLTLLVASSDPKEKDILIKLIKHFLFENEEINSGNEKAIKFISTRGTRI